MKCHLWGRWSWLQLLTAIDESLASNFVFKSFEFICWSHVTFGIKILLGTKVASVVLSACIISRVNRLAISSIFKKSEGSFSKAIAAIKAEFSKEGNFLKINNHILDQFELRLKISFSRFMNSGSSQAKMGLNWWDGSVLGWRLGRLRC